MFENVEDVSKLTAEEFTDAFTAFIEDPEKKPLPPHELPALYDLVHLFNKALGIALTRQLKANEEFGSFEEESSAEFNEKAKATALQLVKDTLGRMETEQFTLAYSYLAAGLLADQILHKLQDATELAEQSAALEDILNELGQEQGVQGAAELAERG